MRYLNYQTLANKYLSGSGAVINDEDPSNHRNIATFQSMSADDVRRLIDAGLKAEREWAKTSPPKRGQILLRAGELLDAERDDFSMLMTVEEGKTLKDSLIEVTRSAATLKFYGAAAFGYGGRTLPSADNATYIQTLKEPLGLVALITPWNFPLSIPVWKLGPALAAGNAAVIKPSSKTPLIVAALLDLLHRAGLPRDVVGIAAGSGKEIGDELVENDDVAAVSFTGSVPVGKGIYRRLGDKRRMTRIQLELGGKNALYIDSGCDLSKAVEFSVRGAFGLTGQSCTATSRAIVHRDAYEAYRKRLLESVKSWKVGAGTDEHADMGPVVDASQLAVDTDYISKGEEEGASLIYGGKKLHGEGYFLEPAVFDGVTRDMSIFNEEIFGPVLGITVVDSFEEGVEMINSVSFGHTAGIVSDVHSNVQRFVKEVDAGVVKVNKPTVGLELQAPFGALKDSGANTWKEMGFSALDFYTREKTAYIGWY